MFVYSCANAAACGAQLVANTPPLAPLTAHFYDLFAISSHVSAVRRSLSQPR
jgi:hypothetical protein